MNRRLFPFFFLLFFEALIEKTAIFVRKRKGRMRMDSIRLFVEELIVKCGVSGVSVSVVRHILLVIVVVLLAMLSYSIGRRLILLLTKAVALKGMQWNHALLVSVCRIIPAVVVWELLPLVFYQYHTVRELLTRITAIYITVMVTRAAIALLDSFNGLKGEERSAKQQYLKSLCGVLKIVAVFLACIFVISIVIGRSPLTLFAGLGATSAILMLVFKDTIAGLVAGIQLTSNDMVHKGDWITVPKADVNGVVEEISLTTVKVRNFDNTIVTVTPQTLVEDSFQNWIGMQQSEGRRVKRVVYYDFRSVRLVDETLRNQLAEKEYFKAEELEGSVVNMALYRRFIEQYLSRNAYVNNQLTFIVCQKEATNTGLPLEFYFFLKNKEWEDYEHQLAEIMEYIYAVTPDFGLKIYQQVPVQ